MRRIACCASLLAAAIAGNTWALELNLDSLTEGIEKLQYATGNVPRKKEIQLGEELSAGLLGAVKLVDDAEVHSYVNQVGRWLAQQTSRNKKKWPWRFGILDTDTVNAFAAPGGHVFVTRGLFVLLENEAELAGVLAHEMGHVLEKHHLGAIQKSTQGEVFQDLLVKSTKKNRAALKTLLGAGMQLYSRGLEREDEYAADRLGVVIAARAGYDPFALLNVLTTVDSLDPHDPNLTLMFSTHPPTAERLARLDSAMEGKLDKYASQSTGADRFLEIRNKLLE
jgi:predicted Zn-dependent protease